MAPKSNSTPVDVERLSIDWGNFRLNRDGSQVKLTPKAAAVLQLLLSEPGVTLTRARILDAAWPDTSSGDEVLTTVINELRRALNDRATAPRYIATVPKLGYRWIGPEIRAESVVEPCASPTPGSRRVGAPIDLAHAPGIHTRSRRSLGWLASAVALIALAAGLWAGGRLPSAAPGGAGNHARSIVATAVQLPIDLQPITSEPGLDLDPDLDRAGDRVAYTHFDGTAVHLRVRELNTTNHADIDVGTDGTPSAPAWSPDGGELAYIWHGANRCELRVVELASGRWRTLADDCPPGLASSIDWSSDGSYLLYSRCDQENGSVAGRNIAVFAINADGSGLRRITRSRRWLTVDGHPRISPDGQSVAFVRDGDGHSQVVVTAVQGTGDERELATPFWPYRVEWTSPGELLVSGHGQTPTELWRLGLDGTKPRRLPADSVGPGISVSGEGRLAVVEKRDTDDNIWSINLGDALARPMQVTAQTRSERSPRISPDGGTLAYLSNETGAQEVSLLMLASSQRKTISSFAPFAPLDLNWSASGNHLAVVLGTDSGKHLAILSAAGEQLELPEAVRSMSVAQAAWSANEAELLLVVTERGRRELHRLNFPELDHDELLVDFSVGWVNPVADDAGLLFTRAQGAALERLASHGEIRTVSDALMKPIPGDQWIVSGSWLAQMQQIERSTMATLTLDTLPANGKPLVIAIAAPAPPWGRNIDLGANRLWYASRDRDEADLVAFELTSPN